MKSKALIIFIITIIFSPNILEAQLLSEFDIEISDGNRIKRTQLEFGDTHGYTTELNIGYDAGLALTDRPENPEDDILTSFGIYSLLVNDNLNEGIAFQIQTLPIDEINNLKIHLGVNVSEDDDVTFTVHNLLNIPSNIRIILEDKLHKKFTQLNGSLNTYTTFVTKEEPEKGRFYLHTTSDEMAPSGPGYISNISFPTNNTNTSIEGNCGPDTGLGSVIIASIPENGFNNLYDQHINLDVNGNFKIVNPDWNPGEYQLQLSCRDKVGNGPSNFLFNNFTIDTTLPSKPIIDEVKEGDIDITGIGENDVEITLNITCVNNPVIVKNGIWKCNLNDTHELEKGKSIEVYATDEAGNVTKGVERIIIGEANNEKKGSRIKYVCKDKNASNYSRFGKHDAAKCNYRNLNENVKNEILSNSRTCSKNKIVKDIMKYGDRNFSPGILTANKIHDVKILQEHINRLIGKEAKDFIIVDGIYGIKTENKVKELQLYFNLRLKKHDTLEVDGIVGPKTREQINNSC